MESKSVINRGEFDRSGRYDAGLKSLVRSLQYAFALLLLAIVAMLIYFFTWGGYFSVEPQQAVIVMRFGRIQQHFTSGGHWFLPYPVNQFIRVQTSQQFMDIDFTAAPSLRDETAANLTPGNDRYLLTGDANIVHSSWKIAYHVANPVRYYETLATPLQPVDNGRIVADDEVVDADGFKGGRGPQTLLRNLFCQAVIAVTAQANCDSILTSGIGAYREEVQREFTALVTAADCGLAVDDVTLNRVFPPGRTKSAFDEVTAAGNTSSVQRSQAQAYRVKVENDTVAKTTEILAMAEAYSKQQVAEIKAESSYFVSIFNECRTDPGPVLMALYTSALSEALKGPEHDKFILGAGDNGRKQLRMLLNPDPRKSIEATPDAESKEQN